LINFSHTQKNNITPWAFFNLGKPFQVKKFDGSKITSEGFEFSGSIRQIYWHSIERRIVYIITVNLFYFFIFNYSLIHYPKTSDNFLKFISNTMDSQLVMSVLNDALEKHPHPKIFNTDQGSQYTSEIHTKRLKDFIYISD
jgi:hypothetical protein